MTNTYRVQLPATTPEHFAALTALAQAVDSAAAAANVEPGLLELLRIRASQLNGCAFCLNLHTQAASSHAVLDRQLHTLAGWRHSPWFTEREKVALELAEALTLLPDGQLSEEVYQRAAAHFAPPALAQLLWVMALINAFNRLAVGSAATPFASSP